MNRSPPVASASSSDQPLKNGDQEQSQSSGAVKRSNATNEGLSYGSRQGATRRQWP